MQLLNVLKLTSVTVMVILTAVTSPALAQNNCGLDNWDGDSSDYLDTNEFSAALNDVDYYSVWDDDGDNMLSEEEWDAGIDEYFGDYDAGVYNDWDLNDDDMISEEEFNDEVFGVVDEDDNDTINQDEWDLFDKEEDGLFC